MNCKKVMENLKELAKEYEKNKSVFSVVIDSIEANRYKVSVNDSQPHEFKTMPEVLSFLKSKLGE